MKANGYTPQSSGLLRGGGGLRRGKVRRNVIRKGNLSHIPDVHLSNANALRYEIPDFDSGLEFEYTQRELLIFAEKILLEDPKPAHEHPAIHRITHLKNRQRHEIYVASGIPDPSIVNGMYWRTHPNGRPWKSKDQRQKTGAGFYH